MVNNEMSFVEPYWINWSFSFRQSNASTYENYVWQYSVKEHYKLHVNDTY